MAIFAENGANMEIDLTIEQTGPHEAIPYELLYEADPSREAVADYIARGSCYIARIEGRTVGVSVLLRTRPFTMELVNLCVAEPYRRQGIATRLIAHAAERARAAECRPKRAMKDSPAPSARLRTRWWCTASLPKRQCFAKARSSPLTARCCWTAIRPTWREPSFLIVIFLLYHS